MKDAIRRNTYGVWSTDCRKWLSIYEDGSRGRDALKHILGDSQVKALQSDGYNVYMYLNDHMVDIEHLCCMAHARTKFKYALEQGNDKDAAFILELIGELYRLERGYEEGRV